MAQKYLFIAISFCLFLTILCVKISYMTWTLHWFLFRHRKELLRLLSTCFSQSMYLPPLGEAHAVTNRWVQYFTSSENRHALPVSVTHIASYLHLVSLSIRSSINLSRDPWAQLLNLMRFVAKLIIKYCCLKRMFQRYVIVPDKVPWAKKGWTTMI